MDAKKIQEGYGLDRMRQLTKKIDNWSVMESDFQIKSEPDHGTKVILCLETSNDKVLA